MQIQTRKTVSDKHRTWAFLLYFYAHEFALFGISSLIIASAVKQSLIEQKNAATYLSGQVFDAVRIKERSSLSHKIGCPGCEKKTIVLREMSVGGPFYYIRLNRKTFTICIQKHFQWDIATFCSNTKGVALSYATNRKW